MKIDCFDQSLLTFIVKTETSQSKGFPLSFNSFSILIISFKILKEEEMCSGELESNEGFVRLAAVEIQVRAHLANSNKTKLVVPDGMKCRAAAELTMKHSTTKDYF